MDVLKKELNAIYEGQNLAAEKLDYEILDRCKRKVEIAADVDSDCRVITDAAADHCYIYGGGFTRFIGYVIAACISVRWIQVMRM